MGPTSKGGERKAEGRGGGEGQGRHSISCLERRRRSYATATGSHILTASRHKTTRNSYRVHANIHGCIQVAIVCDVGDQRSGLSVMRKTVNKCQLMSDWSNSDKCR